MPGKPRAGAHERALIGALSRDRLPNDPELVGARAALRAIMLEQDILQAIAADPPLTADARERLAAILTGADR